MVVMKSSEKFDENEFCRKLLEWFLEKILKKARDRPGARNSEVFIEKGEFYRMSSYPKLDKKEIKMIHAGLEAQGKIIRKKNGVILKLDDKEKRHE